MGKSPHFERASHSHSSMSLDLISVDRSSIALSVLLCGAISARAAKLQQRLADALENKLRFVTGERLVVLRAERSTASPRTCVSGTRPTLAWAASIAASTKLVFVWKSGSTRHINNFELGQHGRNRTNVWDYAGVNSMRAGRLEELAMHPTVKPVALVADAIKDCSRRGGLVLDPFCGSGTILIAAERTGRKARA